jgi:hypothetical protein
MAVDTTKAIPQILETLFLGSSGPVKGFITKSVTQAVPSITASGSARVSAKVPFAATTTVTGANVGDIVIVGQPTVALTGLLSLEGIVTAADTVQLYATEVPNTGVTGASKTFEVIVVDVT